MFALISTDTDKLVILIFVNGTRREYEVLFIPPSQPENTTEPDSILVFTHNILSYQADLLTPEKMKEVEYECVDLSPDLETLVAVVCQEEEEEEHTIALCCEGEEACQDSGLAWLPPRRVLHPESHQMTGGVVVSHHSLQGENSCPPGDKIISAPLHYVFTDGFFSDKEKIQRFPFICLDSSKNIDGEQILVAKVCESQYSLKREEGEGEGEGKKSCLGSYVETVRLANTISVGISCFFLLLTLLVYIKLPELNNLQGKIVLSNIVSILLVSVYLCLVYHLTSLLTPPQCQALGYLGYFATISMFAWMTIMSYDLFRTFQHSRLPGTNKSCLKFACYSVTGWGLSAVLTVLVLCLDLSTTSPHPAVPRPAVGTSKCFLQDGALGLYLHLPVITLLSLNIAFFLATTATLYRHNLHTRFARAGQVSTSRSPVLSQEIREQFVRQSIVSHKLSNYECSLSRSSTPSSSQFWVSSGSSSVSTTCSMAITLLSTTVSLSQSCSSELSALCTSPEVPSYSSYLSARSQH